jgi:hypothetical protein
MITRVKEILTAPKKELAVIEGEHAPHAKVFMGYVLPLSLIPAIAAFIGYGMLGYSAFGVHIHSMSWGIRQAIVQWIVMAGGIYVTAAVINFLAENFGAKKDFDQAFSLVAYSYTPLMIGGIFYILPSLAILVGLAGLYGLYILYLGMQPMMKAPAEKNTGYFVVSLIVTLVVTVVFSAVLGAILLSSSFLY